MSRLATIKLVIFDVDGVLTDGKLYFSNQGEEVKAFHARDGLGIKMLHHVGFQTAIITGRNSTIVTNRAKELGIKLVYQGCPNKVEAFHQCLTDAKVSAMETAYMGDDINDLVLMKQVGFSAVPSNTTDEIKAQVDFIATREGGTGAARELCDLLLKTQNKWDAALKFYGH